MNQERIFQVLVGPHTSEKATIVADLEQPICVQGRYRRFQAGESRGRLSSCSKSRWLNVNTLRSEGQGQAQQERLQHPIDLEKGVRQAGAGS